MSQPGTKVSVRRSDAEAEAARQHALRSAETVPSANVDVSRCDHKSENGRQCILTRHGDDTDHKFRTAGTRKEYAPLPEGFLAANTMEDVPEDEAPVQVKEITRSADQLVIDENVKAAYAAWVEAGKPAEFNKSPRKRRLVPPEYADTVRHMLDSAGTFLGYRVRIAPNKTHESGATMIYFVVTDKTERGKKNGDDK